MSINQLKGLIHLNLYQNPLLAINLAYYKLIGLWQMVVKVLQLGFKVI